MIYTKELDEEAEPNIEIDNTSKYPTEITLNRPQKLFSNIKQHEVAQNKTWFKELSENLRRKTVTAVKP